MASAWGDSWGVSWGDSWGAVDGSAAVITNVSAIIVVKVPAERDRVMVVPEQERVRVRP